MPEKRSSEARMTALADEMYAGIVALAGQRMASDNGKSMLARAARAAGISYRQAKSFYYREAGNPASKAVEAVRAAVPRPILVSVEADLERIARLEREVAELRSLMARALERVASPEAAAAERGHPGSSQGAGEPAEGPRVPSGAVVEAAQPRVDAAAPHDRGRS